MSLTTLQSQNDSRLSRARKSLSHREWVSIGGMAAFILLLHVVGWGVLAGVVEPQNYRVGPHELFGVGLGLTAYTLGMRHAFDADHIAAIDNTTSPASSQNSARQPVSGISHCTGSVEASMPSEPVISIHELVRSSVAASNQRR